MDDLAEAYLGLLKRSLTGTLHAGDELRAITPRRRHVRLVRWLLGRAGLEVARRVSERDLLAGRAIPARAESMVGPTRLDNVQECVATALRDEVPGDLIEAGVWRGGACILMRALLNVLGDTERRVWVADSFAGLPPPEARYSQDRGDRHHREPVLAVNRSEVEANFARYGLLDERVRFVEGWFAETFTALSGETWAVIRLDADMYGSTMDALRHLYPRLSPGGFVIVDDYHALRACRQAVEDFRSANDIHDPISRVDWAGVYWRRSQ